MRAALCVGFLIAAVGCTNGTQKIGLHPGTQSPPGGLNPTMAKGLTGANNLLNAPDPDAKFKAQPGQLAVAFAKLQEDNAANVPDEASRLKQYDEARKAYQLVLKKEPENLAAMRGLGRVYMHMGDNERALSTLKTALAKQPRDASCWSDFALLHNRRKDFAEAIKCYKKSLELDPENQAVIREYGYTLARAGQPDQAVTQLTRVLGETDALYNVGRLLLHGGNTDDAVLFLARAGQRDTSRQDIRELLMSLVGGPQGARPGTTGDNIILTNGTR